MKKRQGYVPVARQFFETRWLRPRVFSPEEAWIDCIQLARYSGGEHPTGVTLRRGEFAASYSWLATRWGWSVKRVRHWISGAQFRADLRAQPRAQPGAQTPTVYSLVNYDTWNPKSGDEGTVGGIGGGTDEGTARGTNKKKGIQKKGVENPLARLVADGVAIWKSEMGGEMSFGRMMKAWGALLEDRPAEEVLDAWRNYFAKNQRAEDRRYCSPEHFASRIGLYIAAPVMDIADEFGRMVPHRRDAGGSWVPVVSVA